MSNRPEIMEGAKVAAEKISKYLVTGFCSYTEEAKTEMQRIIFESMIKSGAHVYDAVEVPTIRELDAVLKEVRDG